MTALAPGCPEAARRGRGGRQLARRRVQRRSVRPDRAERALLRARRRAPRRRARSSRAQKLDDAYLLRLEPDRMLHNFRSNAGLEPKAPVYGGWESVEPWIWIRCHGHTLGHYLTAAACMYESTGDERFARARRLHRRGARGVPGEDRRLAHGVSGRRRAADRQPRGQGIRRRALVHHAQGHGRPARRAPASRLASRRSTVW